MPARTEDRMLQRRSEEELKNKNEILNLLFSLASYLNASGYQTADEVHEAQV